MAVAHVDFEEVGRATLITDAGSNWRATGIPLPASSIEALSLQMGALRTRIFDESQITDTAPVAAGDPGGRGGISLGELAVGFSTDRVGHSVATEAAPHGELMISQLGAPTLVVLWHLAPTEVGIDELAAAVLGRILPVPSAATARFRVAVNADGTGFELVEGGEGPVGSTGSIYATADEYRERVDAGRTVADDLLLAELEAAARLIDQQLEVVPGYFAPTAEATYTFTGRGGRTLDLRDEDGLAYALRSVVAGGIRPDYEFTGDHDQYAWDFDDAFIWPLARNAAQFGRPYFALQLRRVASAPIVAWLVISPARPRSSSSAARTLCSTSSDDREFDNASLMPRPFRPHCE